jgi:hypothetical protein
MDGKKRKLKEKEKRNKSGNKLRKTFNLKIQ